ncbi:omega-conotoxin-like protein 1 [Osmia lignaria lignaria]|uniref:omega-conotoxin-like protein 1 n=1 Tax=Osmia lignaria lignaria TaxID=1437193 RepID=UPI001478FFE0|nr:omega-conotoxin-like protein 1 [Osmia lignaria]
MSKFTMLIFVFLLATTLITAAPNRCGRHGDPCVSNSDCCNNISCHRYANRCQVVITEAELMAQREKILGRKGKDY